MRRYVAVVGDTNTLVAGGYPAFRGVSGWTRMMDVPQRIPSEQPTSVWISSCSKLSAWLAVCSPHEVKAEMMTDTKSDQVDGLDSLRALAALSVVWFHFTQPAQIQHPVLKASGQFGWVGAHMFFVISGFVMPWALERNGYQIGRFMRFMARRLARLHPPYLASLAAALMLALLSAMAPGYRGQPYEFEPRGLLLHLLYLNDWFGERWAIPVYWTLAIEVQFYVVIGLSLPLFTSSQPLVRRASLLALCLAPVVVSDHRSMLAYGAFFALGIATFLLRRGRIVMGEYAAYAALAAAVLASLDVVQAIGGVGMALAILFVRRPLGSALNGLGRISYSLYLLHVPIGGRVMNLGARLDPSPLMEVLLLAVALAASVLTGVLFYRFVELPAQRWSQRIGYERAYARDAATA